MNDKDITKRLKKFQSLKTKKEKIKCIKALIKIKKLGTDETIFLAKNKEFQRIVKGVTNKGNIDYWFKLIDEIKGR